MWGVFVAWRGVQAASRLQFPHVPGFVGVGWAVEVVNQCDVSDFSGDWIVCFYDFAGAWVVYAEF